MIQKLLRFFFPDYFAKREMMRRIRLRGRVFQLSEDQQKLVEKLAPTPAECEQVREAMSKLRLDTSIRYDGKPFPQP